MREVEHQLFYDGGGRRRYPWHKLQVGDYFIVDDVTDNSIRSWVSNQQRRHGKRYAVTRLSFNRFKVIRKA